MTYKGIIFDFNGTLLWDTPLHNQAWNLFLEKHKIQLTDQAKNERIHGKNNRDIFSGLFNRPVEGEELETVIEEKENLYRQLVISEQLDLAKGTIKLFEHLKKNSFPFTIATASGISNLRFYFERYKLDRWFTFDQVVYDDGTLRGKPHPDYFEKAMKLLHLEPNECVIFEDSYAGIQAAENANTGKIIIVNSTNDDYSNYPHSCITDFNQFNLNLIV